MRQVGPDAPKDEVERRESLLSVHELPATVVHPLHHDRLEVVLRGAGVLDVVEETADLVSAPAVAALVIRNEEGPFEVADLPRYQDCRGTELHADHLGEARCREGACSAFRVELGTAALCTGCPPPSARA